MTYDQTRDSEQLRFLAASTADFIARARGAGVDPARQTVFLLPGGMAAKLLRARKPYQDAGPPGQTFQYDTVWLNLSTLLGGALNLAMHEQGGGVRDAGDRIIVADGAVDYLGCTPYSLFTDWCDLVGLGWFVFGWDWRRRIDDVAAFFTGQFLPQFRQQVTAAGLPDPLADFSIVGHSFGGMVVNLVNRDSDPVLAGMRAAITVGGPVYGYGGQIHRWFEGEQYLNDLGKLQVIRTIASFPGTYALPFMDAATFAANRTALADDPSFPLTAYPCMDAVTAALEVDPFDPPVGGDARRYPAHIGFNFAELAHARTVCATLAAPMPAGTATDRFYCIRGVQTTDATEGGITWHTVAPSYNPGTGASPIADAPAPVPGDDTQPAWTARLVTQPDSRIITVQGAIDHAFLMEYEPVQTKIGAILGLSPPEFALAKAARPAIGLTAGPPETASSAEALATVRSLQAARAPAGPDVGRPDHEALLRAIPPDRQRALARRIFKDVLRGTPAKAPAKTPAPGSAYGRP